MIDLEIEKARNDVLAKKIVFDGEKTYFNALAHQQAQQRYDALIKERRAELMVVNGDGGMVSVPEEYTTTAALQHIVESIKSGGSNVGGTLLYVCKVAEQALKAAGRACV